MGGGAVAFTLSSYMIGTLSDRFGRYRFVIASQLLIVISGIGLMISNGFVMLSAFYTMFCVGENSRPFCFLLCMPHTFSTIGIWEPLWSI